MRNLLLQSYDIIRLWPDYLHSYREMQEINETLAFAFKNYLSRTQRMYENHYVMTAHEDGIARFEAELGIIPRDDASLEDRRFEVPNETQKQAALYQTCTKNAFR